MLEYEELEEILDKIQDKVISANRLGQLETLLSSWGLSDLLGTESAYATDPKGKIVVIGGSEVKENILLGIIKSLGIDKDRFEFHLDYNETQKYDYKKLRYKPNYRVVMFGPTPHSSTGKHYSSSVIAEMKNHQGYPRVEVLSANNANKITKSNFRQTLESLIREKYI